jgi:hypothetical protein
VLESGHDPALKSSFCYPRWQNSHIEPSLHGVVGLAGSPADGMFCKNLCVVEPRFFLAKAKSQPRNQAFADIFLASLDGQLH